jgi:hypothetical protein
MHEGFLKQYIGGDVLIDEFLLLDSRRILLRIHVLV